MKSIVSSSASCGTPGAAIASVEAPCRHTQNASDIAITRGSSMSRLWIAEKILNRIQIASNCRRLGTIDAGGYVWHTTGSGRRLTSFKAAQLASRMPGVEKVLFVVDRKDLDYQTMREYDRFERGAANSNTSTGYVLEHFDQKTRSAEHYRLGDRRVHGFNALFATASIDAARICYNAFTALQEDLPTDRRLKVGLIYSHAANEVVADWSGWAPSSSGSSGFSAERTGPHRSSISTFDFRPWPGRAVSRWFGVARVASAAQPGPGRAGRRAGAGCRRRRGCS